MADAQEKRVIPPSKTESASIARPAMAVRISPVSGASESIREKERRPKRIRNARIDSRSRSQS